MFRHFLQIAWRNIVKLKFYSLINISGLAIGIACCLLITLYVRNELSFDQYHVKKDRIYRVLQTFRPVQNGEILAAPGPQDYQVWGCAPVGPALSADYPQIEKVVQFMSPQSLLLQNGEKRFQQENILAIDSTAFDVFSWKMLQGNPHTALVAPNSIVLTKAVAEKLFGDEPAVGKLLRVENNSNFLVTGVMENVPANSHFNFNALTSMTTSRNNRADIFDYWGYVDFYTYILLKENTNLSSLQSDIPQFLKRHNSEDKGYTIAYESLNDAYLHSVATRQPGVTGSMMHVYLFSCIAFFILLIACINFMNLSTARSMERAKEVGVRKVLGVTPSSLRWQFLSESVIIALGAGLIAVFLAALGMPFIDKISGRNISSSFSLTPLLLLCIFLFSIITGLLAGIYPAWFISGFQPISVLKGVFRPSAKGISIRKALVVFQFVLSISLIAGTIIVYSQLKFMSRHDLGFQKDQVITINFDGDQKVTQNIEPIKRSLKEIPGVLAVGASRAVPGEFLPNAGTNIQLPSGQMGSNDPLIYEIDFDFLPTLHIPLVAGRNYSRAFPSDSAQAMIINEAAAKMFGYRNPADAVGRKFDQWGRQGQIIGVVKDFNFRSLHQTVEPLTLRYGYPSDLNFISLEISRDNMALTLAKLKTTWDKIAPQRPFKYGFLDESFSRQYNADQQFGSLFTFFCCLAICIACLGLFALSTFTAQQRIKEIGIRKVLGSTVMQIVLLLCRDFVKLVLIALIIAIPLCWWVMDQWLQDFAYRISIGPIIFLEAGTVSILIALLTITGQSLKAALANPVTSLKSE